MKLTHVRAATDRVIGLVTGWHDELVERRNFIACDHMSAELHAVLDPAECDFVMATVSGDSDTSYSVIPARGMIQMPTQGPAWRLAHAEWEAHAAKFAVVMFRQENDAEIFEGFVTFQDALRFISGIIRPRRSRWPLVIDAEAAHFRARGQLTGVEWPDERE